MAVNKLNHDKMVKISMAGILTAVVVVFQMLGSFIRFGAFSVSLVLVPIGIGAALCGPVVSAWLGLAFGITVLLTGDAALFLSFNVPATIIVVLLKGALSGLLAGLTFNLFKKLNTYLAVVTAAVVCPLVNTGIFFLGCRFIFYDYIASWGKEVLHIGDPMTVILSAFIGFNFFFELGVNMVLAPVVVRIVDAVSTKRKK